MVAYHYRQVSKFSLGVLEDKRGGGECVAIWKNINLYCVTNYNCLAFYISSLQTLALSLFLHIHNNCLLYSSHRNIADKVVSALPL